MSDEDLSKLLELAENITRYRGFLGRRDQEAINQNTAEFAKLRRVFIHRYAKREGTLGLHKAQLTAALQRVAAVEGVPDYALDFACADLLDHLGKEHQRSPITRLLVRWVPPAIALMFALISYAMHLWPALKDLLS